MSRASGPIQSWRVLVTASEPERFATALEASGARPIAVPMIEIRPVDSAALDGALNRLGAYEWCVFTSASGVRCTLDRAAALGIEVPASLRFAVVGPRTGEVLEARGFPVDAMPEEHAGVAIADRLGPLDQKRILLPRAARAGADLPVLLAQHGARVDEVVAYETVEGPEASRPGLDAALAGSLDAVVFTSGSTVRGFIRLADDAAGALAGSVVACLGATAAEAVRSSRLGSPRVARDRSPAGVVAVLEEHARSGE